MEEQLSDPENVDSVQGSQASTIDLGPFTPPIDFDHGEEFESESPRPIPRFLRAGSHAQRHRGMIYSLVALGAMFILIWPTSFVEGLSQYILPLKWLHWIGFGLIGIGVWKFIAGVLSSGRYAYVRDGIPFVGRVLDQQAVRTGTEEAPTFAHIARIEFQHPETNEHVVYDFQEYDHWPLMKSSQFSCQLQPGDYVTLVYLPERKSAPIALYGFLGLDPEREFVQRNGQPIKGMSPFTAIMVAFLIAFVVVLAMAFFDVMMFSFPIDGGWKLPLGLAVGGFVLGGLLGTVIWKTSKNPTKSKSSFPSFLGIGLLGAIAAPLVMLILNSRLDAGATELTPVQIVEFWETTHNFVIRDYEIEYRPLVGGDTTKKHMRFSQIQRLAGSRYAAMEVSPGRFGFSWVKGIHPINWIPQDASSIKEPVYEVKSVMQSPETGEEIEDTTRVVPVIVLDRGFAPLPPGLLEAEVAYLRQLPEIQDIYEVKEEVPGN